MECSTAETPCDTAKASKKEPVRNFVRTGSFLSAAFRTDSERGGMIGCLFDFFFRTARKPSGHRCTEAALFRAAVNAAARGYVAAQVERILRQG